METFALELNDAGLQVARRAADGAPVVLGDPSPGFAVLQDGRVYVGAEAAGRYRVAPLHAQNRYWHALGLEPLAWSVRGVATAADLAHAHLSGVLAAAGATAGSELLVAVPPGYSREQLGLLVGIASECGVVVRGLVDAGVAACATIAPAPCLLHLDLQLHQATATLVEVSRGDGQLRRARYELLPGAGVLALQQAMGAAVANAFVRETRFDPLHQAATEQSLHDQLPGWLDALRDAEEVTAEIALGATAHRIQLPRQLLVDAVATFGNDILRLLQAARPPGVNAHLCVSPRVSAVPGLLARLAALRDSVVVQLPAAAPAAGALRAAAAIVRPADAMALVHRLPLADGQPASVEPAPASAGVELDAVPTHVLFRGRAWPITAVPLTLGWSVGTAARALTLPAGMAGVSRSHCTLQLQDGQAVVADHSTYGTFVNDERVGGRLALQAGDVLRLGAPGVALELIRVLPDHGTP